MHAWQMARSVHLVLLGPHTRVVASLCGACPLGPTGCCTQPPDLSWTDIGRIVALGGLDWLLAERREKRLLRGPRGLVVERIAMESGPEKKCVYHAEQGCTVSPDKRSAACNYYVCADALTDTGTDESGVEAASAAWTTQYAAWDEDISAEVGGWGTLPEDASDEAPLFERLGRRFRELAL